MGKIKLLDTHTINKIAAGEVVERPSSVVKEVVENSIDASASSITVEIKGGGIEMIRVTDNGTGIPKDQVEIAFLRHATSKISNAEDLYEVVSLGFRGEALASIAAVSHIELLTKTEEEVTGKQVEISGGKIIRSEEIACPNGTTFIMRHLFYNVPARLAFLKSAGTEGAKITDYMYKLALAHPEIAFTYIQNGKTLFSTSGDHELMHCVLNIYGREYVKNSLKCYYKSDEIECTGLLGKPSLNRGNRNYEHFFINGRYIRSQILQEAVEEAYKTLVMVGKFPFVILHLTMNPALVDVNVHPTKLQVRFKNTERVHRSVYDAVSHTLSQVNLVPDIALDKPHLETSPHPEFHQTNVETFFAPRKTDNTPSASSLLGEEQTKLELEQWAYSSSMPKASYLKEQGIDRLLGPAGSHSVPNEVLSDTPSQVQEDVNMNFASNTAPYQAQLSDETSTAPNLSCDAGIQDYRIVGQLFKTYWMIQYHDKIFIIDQHAAHERVLYEKFMAHFKSGKVATQLLLVPETLHITPLEKELLETHKALFTKLGFHFEPFGETAIVIREVPYIFNEPLSPHVFEEVLDRLSHEKLKDITDIKAEAIIKLSCRSAIKAHDALSESECHELIKLLLALDNPFTCPHGRPTLVALTQKDIEKMFKRIV